MSLDAYRAFFGEPGGNTVDAARRLRGLAERAQRAAPDTRELKSALESDDPRRVALATASLSVSEHPSAELLDALLGKFPHQPDAVVRRLSIDAFARADDAWLSRRGEELAREVSEEKNPLVNSVLILGVLPRLDRADELVAAMGLASVATSETRQVLYASLYLRGGSPALDALAAALRGKGRQRRASEVEAASRTFSCDRAQALAVAEERAIRAKAPDPGGTATILGPSNWGEFLASRRAVAESLPAAAAGALSRSKFYAAILRAAENSEISPNVEYWVFIDESTCQVLYSGRPLESVAPIE